MRSNKRGFTLLELTVALALAGVVTLLASRMLVGIGDSADRLANARRELDRAMNARRWLSETFGSLDVGGEGGGFRGQSDVVEFDAEQRVSEGWLETRHISLGRSGDSLIARDSAHEITLFHGIRGFQCDYLLEPGATAIWLHEWISPVTAPLAVRLRIGFEDRVDTLFLLVGSRG